MDNRSTEIIEEILRIQKSLATPLRKQWYRNLAEHIGQQAAIIEQQQVAIHNASHSASRAQSVILARTGLGGRRVSTNDSGAV